MRFASIALAALAAPVPMADDGPLIRRVDRPGGIVRVDPVSLAPRSRVLPVRGDGDSGGFALAPDRGLLAIGGGNFGRPARLRLVDVGAWRSLGTIALPGSGPGWPLAWPRADRLHVAVGARGGRTRVAVVDPLARAVLRRAAFPGTALTHTGGPFGLVALSARFELGSARLVHIDPDGHVATVRLRRILAGFEHRFRRGRVPRTRFPGLAVGDGRAYVVSAGADLVAEVDLATRAVAYHRLGPAAQAAKSGAFDERSRSAVWLGDGVLAVSGENRRFAGRRNRYRAHGLRLLDTRSGTVRRLARRPAQITLAGDLVLATGRAGGFDWDRAGRRDAGLTAWDARGRRRFARFRGEDVTVLGSHAGSAYAWVRRTRRVHTVDLASGRSLHVQRVTPSRLPRLLTPTAAGAP